MATGRCSKSPSPLSGLLNISSEHNWNRNRMTLFPVFPCKLLAWPTVPVTGRSAGGWGRGVGEGWMENRYFYTCGWAGSSGTGAPPSSPWCTSVPNSCDYTLCLETLSFSITIWPSRCSWILLALGWFLDALQVVGMVSGVQPGPRLCCLLAVRLWGT